LIPVRKCPLASWYETVSNGVVLSFCVQVVDKMCPSVDAIQCVILSFTGLFGYVVGSNEREKVDYGKVVRYI
jgi:hypothetical protein